MKKTYLITERAGRYVAGQRKPDSDRIELSDNQAAYELALGTLVLAPDDTAVGAGQEEKIKRRKAAETSEKPAWNKMQPSASTLTE